MKIHLESRGVEEVVEMSRAAIAVSVASQMVEELVHIGR